MYGGWISPNYSLLIYDVIYLITMKIYAVRHGQTNYNVKGLCNNDPSKDVHLTEEGTKQAEDVARKLKDREFEAIFVTSLKRTRQTADIINQLHIVEVVEEPRLSDRKTGFDSKPASEFFAAIDSSENKITAKFNDGESFAEERKRVFHFLDELVKQSYKSVLLVSHTETMTIIYGYFHEKSDDEMWNMDEFSNAEVVEFEA